MQGHISAQLDTTGQQYFPPFPSRCLVHSIAVNVMETTANARAYCGVSRTPAFSSILEIPLWLAGVACLGASSNALFCTGISLQAAPGERWSMNVIGTTAAGMCSIYYEFV